MHVRGITFDFIPTRLIKSRIQNVYKNIKKQGTYVPCFVKFGPVFLPIHGHPGLPVRSDRLTAERTCPGEVDESPDTCFFEVFHTTGTDPEPQDIRGSCMGIDPDKDLEHAGGVRRQGDTRPVHLMVVIIIIVVAVVGREDEVRLRIQESLDVDGRLRVRVVRETDVVDEHIERIDRVFRVGDIQEDAVRTPGAGARGAVDDITFIIVAEAVAAGIVRIVDTTIAVVIDTVVALRESL